MASQARQSHSQFQAGLSAPFFFLSSHSVSQSPLSKLWHIDHHFRKPTNLSNHGLTFCSHIELAPALVWTFRIEHQSHRIASEQPSHIVVHHHRQPILICDSYTMSLLRQAAAGASRSSAVLRTASAPVQRHFSTSRVAASKDPQLGDYPDLPFVSQQQRKYSPKWWDPQEKRNFGETVSHHPSTSNTKDNLD